MLCVCRLPSTGRRGTTTTSNHVSRSQGSTGSFEGTDPPIIDDAQRFTPRLAGALTIKPGGPTYSGQGRRSMEGSLHRSSTQESMAATGSAPAWLDMSHDLRAQRAKEVLLQVPHTFASSLLCACHFSDVVAGGKLEEESSLCLLVTADKKLFSCHDPAVPRGGVQLQQQCILTAEAARRLSGQAFCSLCDNTRQQLRNPVTAPPSHCTSVVDGLLNSDKPSAVSQPGANNILHDCWY